MTAPHRTGADHTSARAAAQRELDLLYLGDDVVIDDAATVEHPRAWVFFYNTKAYVESHAFDDMLLGVAPFIVDRETGDLRRTISSRTWESYLDDDPEVVPS